MPDFFLDRIVSLNQNVAGFSKAICNVVARKGGSIDEVRQADFRGGNAANTMSALAALDAEVYPILQTSLAGFETLKFYLKHLNVDLSHVKTEGEASLTTSLEFASKNRKANVMLRNVGALEQFGPKNLDAEDYALLCRVDYVCVFNWAGTRRYGTELAAQVFGHVKSCGKGKTYYDTADPTPCRAKIPTLIRKVLSAGIVDVLSVNENEVAIYAKHLADQKSMHRLGARKELKPIQCAGILAENISARIDLHTSKFAASLNKKSEAYAQAFNVPVMRVTGAGDAWNAGNIFGDAQGFHDVDRLMLANAVAAYYVSSPSGEHPSISELIKFCEDQLILFKR